MTWVILGDYQRPDLAGDGTENEMAQPEGHRRHCCRDKDVSTRTQVLAGQEN